jgi:hypothetical protein
MVRQVRDSGQFRAQSSCVVLLLSCFTALILYPIAFTCHKRFEQARMESAFPEIYKSRQIFPGDFCRMTTCDCVPVSL